MFQFSNFNRVMEAGDHFKNGASSKSQTNKENILIQLSFALLISIAILSGCKESDTEEEELEVGNVPAFINAKWEISDPNSDFKSFEFNKDGNFIVVTKAYENEYTFRSGTAIKSSLNTNDNLFQRNNITLRTSALSPVHFGTYSIQGDTITLSEFGTINVISITAATFNFSFKLTSTGESWEFTTQTHDPVTISSRTEMLCRSWKLDRVRLDFSYLDEETINYYEENFGEDWKEKEEKEANEETGLIILFSKAGTYLIMYPGAIAGLSEWKWVNNQETSFYYSWDNWYEGWQENVVYINELSNTTLKLQELSKGNGCMIIYELLLSNK